MTVVGATEPQRTKGPGLMARLTGRTPGQWRKWGRIMTSPPN